MGCGVLVGGGSATVGVAVYTVVGVYVTAIVLVDGRYVVISVAVTCCGRVIVTCCVGFGLYISPEAHHENSRQRKIINQMIIICFIQPPTMPCVVILDMWIGSQLRLPQTS